jgi:hypothetical protein
MKQLATTQPIDALADATEGALSAAVKPAFAANDVLDVLQIVALPANDEPFVAELVLSGEPAQDVEALLAQDPEYASECDRRRDAWIDRVELDQED